MERLSDTVIEILNELHTERLAYNGEYLPLIEAAHKLAAYEDAEEQGRLIVLPCTVGDTIYYIKTLQNGADTKVIEHDTVKRIIFDGIDNQKFDTIDGWLDWLRQEATDAL